MSTSFNIQEKDTVRGRLNQAANFNNPFAKRVASFAKREGAARKLTNSSITVGNALGNIIDQEVDIAKTDSTNFISTGNANAANATSMRNAALSAETQLAVQRMNDIAASQRLAAQIAGNERISGADIAARVRINNDNINANSSNLATEIASREGINTANINANSSNLDKEIASREGINTANINANSSNLATEIASREGINTANINANSSNLDKELATNERINAANNATRVSEGALDRSNSRDIAALQIKAQADNARFDRENAVLLTNLNNENSVRLENMRQKFTVESDFRRDKSAAWESYQTGIATIDPNASIASQNEVFTRQTDAFEARVEFIEDSALGSNFEHVTSSAAAGTAQGISPDDLARTYEFAKAKGLSATDVDRAAGLPEGTSEAYVASMGWDSL